jgi:hypothetical protein
MCDRAKQLARLTNRLGTLSRLQLDEVECLVARLEVVPGGPRVLKESDDKSSHSKSVGRNLNHRPAHPITFVLLIVLFTLANLLMPGLFWHVGDEGMGFNAAVFCFGGLTAQVCVLAIWGAMAANPAKYRVPISVGLVLVVGCSYCLGLQLPDYPDSDMPLTIALFLLGLGLVMYACLFVLLWILRRLVQKRIAVPSETLRQPHARPSGQFGLRYLLMCPVALSGIIILLQYSLPRHAAPFGNLARLLEFLVGAFAFIAFSALICIPCVWLVLADKRRWPWAVGLGIVWLGGPWLIMTLLRSTYPLPPGAFVDAVVNATAFGSGMMVTTLLVLFIMHFLGYRLLSPLGESPFAKDSPGESPFAETPLDTTEAADADPFAHLGETGPSLPVEKD